MTRIRRITVLLATVAVALPLAACAEDSATEASIAVENCGETVTFDAPPESVTLLKSASVPALDSLGVLDRVTAKAGQYPEEYYDDELNARLDEIPTLTDQLDAGGHLQISREAVVAANPDLVIGHTDTINPQTMQASSIPTLEEPALCGHLDGDASFEDVYDQVRLYGTVFGREDVAEDTVADLRAQVDELTERVPADEERTVAVLYPTVGGGVTYAYGTGSMSHPVVEAAGLSNVFADQDERVFEVSGEELIGCDPDVILALYSQGDPDAVADAVAGLPGAEAVSAVQDQAVVPMLMNYAEPPTLLAVEGLETLVDYLEQTR